MVLGVALSGLGHVAMAEPEGKLASDVIQRVVFARFDRFAACYDAAAGRDHRLSVRLSIAFVIAPDGAVTEAHEVEPPIADGMGGCIVREFGALQFPPPEGGAVHVTFPMVFGIPAEPSQEPHPLVRFEPEGPDLTLMRGAGQTMAYRTYNFRHVTYFEAGKERRYVAVCEGPCLADLAPGDYDLALQWERRKPVPAGRVSIVGPVALRGEYKDRFARRVVGGFVGFGALIGGFVMIFAASGSPASDAALLGGGISVIVGGGVGGAILAMQDDQARIIVTPLTLPPTTDGSPGAPHAMSSHGAGLTLRF
jgi:hypothetical protein